MALGKMLAHPYLCNRKPENHEINFKDNGLLGFIKNAERFYEYDERFVELVKDGFVHSTGLDSLCLRAVSISRRLELDPNYVKKNASSNDQLVWSIGRAVESHIRKMLLRSLPRGRLIGKRTCDCGSLVNHVDAKLKELYKGDYCHNCDSHDLNYIETSVVLEEYRAILSPDMTYANEYGEIVVVEIKSIKKDDFLKLDKALPAHVKQAFRYHLAFELKGHKAADYVRIIYASKDHTGPKTNPYKEFKVPVNRESSVYKSTLDSLNSSSLLKLMGKKGEMPNDYLSNDGYPEMICKNIKSPLAKDCPVKSLCFSIRGNYE